MAINIAPKSLDTDLSELMRDVASGKAQLPEFQRSWTWDDNRIIGILASLSQGYPMGAVMRLAYGNENVKFKYRTIEGVPVSGVVPEYLILDGQQRLTSMYRATCCKAPVKTTTEKGKEIERYYYLDINKCLDENEDREDAVFSIPADRKVKTNFDRDVILDLSTNESEYEKEMFPLNIVFDGGAREDWADGYKEYHGYNKKFKEKYKQFRTKVLDTITGYKLPVITLGKETPREAVCKVFENVNTGGVPLTVFELVTATFATYEFDLRDDWNKCRDIIRGKNEQLNTDVMYGVDETAFLTAVTLFTTYHAETMTTCKKKDVLSLAYEDYQENKTKLLETQNILSRWFWCGIMGEMYGGANETRYANDMEDVIAAIKGKESQNRTVNAAYFSATRLISLQTRNSAAYKGIMALVYRGRCHDFVRGTTIDIVKSMDEAPDIHHIFPEAYCIKKGYKKKSGTLSLTKHRCCRNQIG